MPAKYCDAAYDYPQESFEQITLRLVDIKCFTDKSAAFKQDCRKWSCPESLARMPFCQSEPRTLWKFFY
jgi:hypothetical protein